MLARSNSFRFNYYAGRRGVKPLASAAPAGASVGFERLGLVSHGWAMSVATEPSAAPLPIWVWCFQGYLAYQKDLPP